MNSDFLSALKQIEKQRNIPLTMLLHAIEDALVAAYKRNFGSNQNVIIEIDRHNGELHIWQRKLVVPEVTEPGLEMSLEEARNYSPDSDIGMEIDLEVPNDTFGRIAALTAKQVIWKRIREAEREFIYGEYVRREGELVSGTVQRYEHGSVLIDLGRADGVIPPSEQAHNERFRHGDRVKAYVMEVKNAARGPMVVLSRAQPGFLMRLFELEVPEIRNGIIQVKAVVREAGLRSKIVVKSLDLSIDPVGACVGPKGSRVQAVVDELRGEKIDVIPWSDDSISFVANSLQPARVSRVRLYENDRSAIVVVPDQQLSLAVGKEGQNARLAARLTGWKLDIKSESQARGLPEQEEYPVQDRSPKTTVPASAPNASSVNEMPSQPQVVEEDLRAASRGSRNSDVPRRGARGTGKVASTAPRPDEAPSGTLSQITEPVQEAEASADPPAWQDSRPSAVAAPAEGRLTLTRFSPIVEEALEKCKLRGLEASPLQGQSSEASLRRVESLAERAGAKRPLERAEYCLTAARLCERVERLDPQRSSENLRKAFRSLGDHALSTGNTSEMALGQARIYYAESLRLQPQWVKWEASEPCLVLLRYIKSWVATPGEVLRTQRHEAGSEKVFRDLVGQVRDSKWLAYLALSAPSAADFVWQEIEKDPFLSDHLLRMDPAIQNWQTWRKLRRAHYDEARREVKCLFKTQWDSLEDACERLKDSPCLVMDLDQDYLGEITAVGREAAEFARETLFEEQERLAHRLTTRCDEVVQKMEEQPTLFALESLRGWLLHLREQVDRRFQEVLSRSVPVLSLVLPLESFYPDPNREIELQLQLTNQVGCSPASHLELHIAADPEYFQVGQRVLTLDRSLRGGESYTQRVPVRVTSRSLEDRVFPLEVTAYGQDRAGRAVTSQATKLSVRLYPASEFQEIENKYAPYAGGTPVKDIHMFFGRQALIERLVSILSAPGPQASSILLYGQKRSGKSTVLSHLKRRLTFPCLPVEFSLGDIVEGLSLAKFLFRIIQVLEFQIEDLEHLAPPKLEFPRCADFQAEPMIHFHSFMESFSRACKRTPAWSDCRLILLVDEFSYLYDEIKSGRVPENFMKTWKALVERGYFRTVLVGQDFMPRFKKRFPNEFGVTLDERITYLAKKPAEELIENPIRIQGESRFRGRARERILELTAGSPYYLQIFCHNLVEYMNEKQAKYCTDSDVEQVKERLVSGVHALEFDKFDNLIGAGDEPPDRRAQLESLLRAISRTKAGWWCRNEIGGLAEADLNDILVDLVQRDVLEQKSGDYYRIRVGLFRDWLAAH
jgi:N utilization substance protein A